MKGSWIWRVLTLAILSLATRTLARKWLKESFQMQLQPGSPATILEALRSNLNDGETILII